MPLAEGSLLSSRYRILRVLGGGGMSCVYLAEDTRLSIQVAIKENLQTGPEEEARFEREAHLLAALSHPCLPRVMDHFHDAETGHQYLVMSYVEGEDLDTILKRDGPVPEQQALAWVREIMGALQYLHSQNPPVIHRDIKPANLKITPEGQVKLVDFGIAKTYQPGNATVTGAPALTPGFAPPEQYGLNTTVRTDVYSLGATLYAMLTGKTPPEPPMRLSGVEPLVPPATVRASGISWATEAAVMRALELDETRRYQSVAEMLAALDVLAVPTQRAGSQSVRIGPWDLRLPDSLKKTNPRLLVAGAAGVVLAACLGLTGVSLMLASSCAPAATPTVTALPTVTPTQIPPTPTEPVPTATTTSTATRVVPTATPPRPTSTPTPAPPPPPPCPSGSCISYPANGSTVRGVIQIWGTANVPRFARYKVEYRPVNEPGWRCCLVERITPVAYGSLMEWYTTTVPVGRYRLRLTVVDVTGNYPEPSEIELNITR